jgi:hypothetical protein
VFIVDDADEVYGAVIDSDVEAGQRVRPHGRASLKPRAKLVNRSLLIWFAAARTAVTFLK